MTPSPQVQTFVAALLHEGLHDPEITARRRELLTKYPQLQDLAFYVNNNQLFVQEIRVKPEFRNQGIGSKVIADLKELSRDLALPLVLAPEADPGKKAALDRFYRRQGLVPNKGRHRDYALSSMFGRTMYWKPPKA